MPFREIPDAELNQPLATFREIPSKEVTFKETKPTVTEEVHAAIPEIVSQLRQAFIQPPQQGAEFTPQQLQAAEGFQPPRFREIPEIPFESVEQPEFQQAGAQRTMEAAGEVAKGLGRTATFAAAVANAAAGTALGMSWDTLQPQWERVKELGDQAPLEEISNVLSAGLLIYGGIEGLKAVPKLYTMARNSNLLRKLTIPERGLTTIPDSEMYRIYQTAPDSVKKEMATYNPQVRSILLDPAKVQQFSAQEAATPARAVRPGPLAPIETPLEAPGTPALRPQGAVPAPAGGVPMAQAPVPAVVVNAEPLAAHTFKEVPAEIPVEKKFIYKDQVWERPGVSNTTFEILPPGTHGNPGEEWEAGVRVGAIARDIKTFPSKAQAVKYLDAWQPPQALVETPVEMPKEPWQMTKAEAGVPPEPAPVAKEVGAEAQPTKSWDEIRDSIYARKNPLAIQDPTFDSLQELSNRLNRKPYNPDLLTPEAIKDLKAKGFVSGGLKNPKITSEGSSYLGEIGRKKKEIDMAFGNESDILVDKAQQEYLNAQKTGTQIEAPNQETPPVQGPGAGVPVRGPAEVGVEAAKGEVAPPAKPPEPPAAPPAAKAPEPPQDPVAKFRAALRNARSVRAQQEEMYTAERRGRFARSEEAFKAEGKGEQAYYSAIGKLKGEFEKKEFEAIRSQFPQEQVDELIKMAGDSPLSYMDQVTVIRGVVKMLNGIVPQNNELLKMKKVYGKELVQELEEKRSVFKRGVDLALELANIPRAIKSGLGDMSAGLRQGVFFITRPEWWKAWAPSFKSFWGFKKGWGETFYDELQKGFEQDPDYELMHDSGLSMTDLENPFNREETFQSNMAEKIPIIGRSIRASGRAYTAYLNKLRFDVWKSIVDNAKIAGIDMRENPKALKELSNFVNEGTGRGRLGVLEPAARTLNALIWSPRLAASRLILMGRVFNPNTYTKLDPIVRREYLKSLLGFIGVGTGILGVAKMSGLRVGTDPTSADFGKIIIGNTRIGVFSNFPQWPRMLTQIITKKYTSSVTGKVVTLGEGYKPITRFDILTRAIESKESPMMAYFTKLLKQQDAEGNPTSVTKETADLFMPIIAQDLVDLAKSDPKLVPLIAYSFAGGDVQTYGGSGLVGKITTFRNKIVSEQKREPTETEKFQLYQQMRTNPEDRKLLGDMTPRMFRKSFSNYTIGNTGEIGSMASALMMGDEDFKVKKLQEYEDDLSKDDFSKVMVEVSKNHIVSRKVIQQFYRAKLLNQ